MNSKISCEATFDQGGPFWHLYTDGGKMEIIFTCPSDFVFGITLLGICAATFPNCRILTFALMSNHIHLVIAGRKEDVLGFFALYKERLRRYLGGLKRYCRMDNFEVDVFEIPDLRALRNEIVYVNRNGYVVHPECTPFSYWWSAGIFFFNSVAQMLPAKPFAELTLRDRRAMCRSREAGLPANYQVLEAFRPDRTTQASPLLLATSFCAIREAELYFPTAHHYFRMVSRDIEAFSDVARRLGDRIFLTDEELYRAVLGICAKEYDTTHPGLLPAAQKQDVARRMHFDYNASNKQIQRILKMSSSDTEELFPQLRCPSSK